jgi:acetylornithine deacetylase/succinyl-diaminopimelate desuccinylase-like protein
MIRFSLVCSLAVALASGCSHRVVPPEFDGARAFKCLEQQVEFGPRVPGTAASARCREYFYRQLQNSGFSVDSQAFKFFDPYASVDTPMVNVVARFRGNPDDERAILLTAHYDSRPRTDYHSDSTLRYLPIAGADDGG